MVNVLHSKIICLFVYVEVLKSVDNVQLMDNRGFQFDQLVKSIKIEKSVTFLRSRQD